MTMHIWCDGACKGNPGPGGWGVYVEGLDEPTELYGGSAHTTNNIMELTAMIEALRVVKAQQGSAVIYVDSQYVKNGMQEWVSGWKKKNWKTAKGDPVKNKELWEELDSLYQALTPRTTIEWVKGHSGDKGNDKADELANKGCKPYL
jgi:ribonuclease HI